MKKQLLSSYSWRFSRYSAMSGQHWENYDVKQEIVHCYPRNVDCCCTSFVNREVKHDVNGRRQTAKITSDFEFFSSNP